MKKTIVFTILIFRAVLAYSQIHMLRYDDNFAYLKGDSIRKTGLENLKHIKLTQKTNISFGGEVREQFQYYQNQNFGDIPPNFSQVSTGQVWQRLMLHSNLEMGNMRMFIQMGSTFRFANPNPQTPEIDENKLSLHQAFIDYRLSQNWMARVGRQEISYGNNRLITFREGPNTRLAFDAFILKYGTTKRKLDLFYMTPVVSKPGVFDDRSFDDNMIGAYATESIWTDKIKLDYYFINFTSQKRQYNYLHGNENRQSYGFRLLSKNERLNYELECTYQSGKFNHLTIDAYGLSAEISYKVVGKKNIIIGLSGNNVSGDKNSGDSKLNTFNLLFSKPQYGLAAPIGATNIISVNPYLTASPHKNVSAYAGLYLLWRQSNRDGTYSPLAIEVRPIPSLLNKSTGKQIASLFTVGTTYAASGSLSLSLDAAYFKAGNFAQETGKGKNIAYFSFKMGYKF